jgi:glycosyltransferase involved in cell wall biosynthesis
MLSVVLRCKNEAPWIARTLFALANQRMNEIEPIVVDNESTDGTAEIARRMGARVVTIGKDEFTYGRAINVGAALASNPYIAILSAHCVPVNELWADYLVAALIDEPDVAGAYGRQEPLPDSAAFDKRDLWLTFRDQRLRQTKDAFFHNANSVVPREIWQAYPFDEKIEGQEDREWGQRMIRLGFTLRYEPNARVYHFHGIHQGRNEARAERVVRMIETLTSRGNGDHKSA